MTRKLLLCLALLGCVSPAWAVLTQARATPSRSVISVAQGGQSFAITWVVNTDAAHTLGAVSAQGNFVNAATGAVIAPPVNLTIGAGAGTGPLSYAETITVSGAQVETWRSQGIRLVGFRRSFVAPGGPPVAAQWLLQIRGAGLDGAREPAGGALAVQRMELVFARGHAVIVPRGQPLAARVTIGYAGSGTLRGRWEIADPGSQGGGFFRVLSLVREPLAGGVAVTLDSPPLPTQATGRHALRFCVEQALGDPCASSATAVQTFYEVVPGDETRALRGVSPDNGVLGAAGMFRWPATPGVTTWQLQVFAPAVPPAQEPRFVTGMLLPGAEHTAPLSRLMRGKLRAGERYLWRVTAHGADGALITGSQLVPFVFRP